MINVEYGGIDDIAHAENIAKIIECLSESRGSIQIEF